MLFCPVLHNLHSARKTLQCCTKYGHLSQYTWGSMCHCCVSKQIIFGVFGYMIIMTFHIFSSLLFKIAVTGVMGNDSVSHTPSLVFSTLVKRRHENTMPVVTLQYRLWLSSLILEWQILCRWRRHIGRGLALLSILKAFSILLCRLACGTKSEWPVTAVFCERFKSWKCNAPPLPPLRSRLHRSL